MGNKLYVGNLAYSMTDESLQQHFAEFGSVLSAKVMIDRDSGRSKGFGFVEMGTADEAQAAIRGLNGKSIEGRGIVVNEARPKESSGSGGGGQRRDSGYRGGRRGY
ncbi:MAG TPA: RNA-binding protein [Burkholderiaceae bacterium]|nr:RNA-binding protein [Burkholderiaceae bacterium]